MQTTLNFSAAEFASIKKLISSFEKLPSSSQHEEIRANHKGCSITLYKSGKLLIQGENHKEVASEILLSLKIPPEIIVGIDEVGRGENNGPFVISAVLADRNSMRQFRDSKKTSGINEKAAIVSEKALAIASYSVNAGLIDELRGKGMTMNEIEEAAIDSMASFFRSIYPPARIIVDGNPMKTKSKGIEFIPKADDKEAVVGAASLVAKSTRNSSSDKKTRKSWKQNHFDL